MHQDTKSARLIAVCKRTFKQPPTLTRTNLGLQRIVVNLHVAIFVAMVD